MTDIYFDKLYRYDRIAEPCYIGIPVREGELWDTDGVRVYQSGKRQPLQAKVTSRHKDGSVRFLFLRFLADLPGCKGTVLQYDLHGGERTSGWNTTAGIFLSGFSLLAAFMTGSSLPDRS